MGPLDPRPRGVAADAALAHRQDRRHPALQERPLAERRPKSTPSCKWVDAGAPKGDPKDMPAPVKWPSDDVWNFAKQFGKPDLVIKSPAYTQKARRDGRVVQARRRDRSHRAALGARHRDASRHDQGPQDHPPRAGPPAAGRRATHGPCDQRPTPTSPAPASSWNGPSASRARSCAPNTGKLMLPGSKIALGHPLPRRRRGHHRRVELGIYFYPKGQEPKYRTDAGALQRHHRRQPRPRHRAQLDQRARRTST